MKTTYLFLIISCSFLISTFDAAAQYRKVHGQIYGLTDPNAPWTSFRTSMLVRGFSPEGFLVLQEFTDVSVQDSAAVVKKRAYSQGHAERKLGQTIILKNYPLQSKLNVRDEIPPGIIAMRVGLIYDYGTDYQMPVRPLTAAEQKALTKQKSAQDVKTFQWLCSQATNGSVSAECSLGEHYLNGIGTDPNHEAAIEWLKKAAAQGDAHASNVLARISMTNTSTNQVAQ
jgi:TPR repeat protein